MKEVATVYDAYFEFTGKQIPRLSPSSNVRLSNVAYDRLKAKTNEFLARYDTVVEEFLRLSSTITKSFAEFASETEAMAERAAQLSTQGLQAGAYSLILTAYAQLTSLTFAGEAIELFVTDGIDGLNSKIAEAEAIDTRVIAFLDNLKTYDPTTVSEAASLMNAYGGVFDAFSLSGMALRGLDDIIAAYNAGKISLDDTVAGLTTPLIYLAAAGVQVEGTQALFDVGRDLGGPDIVADVDLAGLAKTLDCSGRRYHHIEGVPFGHTLAHLRRGVESDRDLVAGLLFKGCSRRTQARLNRSAAHHRDFRCLHHRHSARER